MVEPRAVEVGDVLYVVYSERAGHTTMRRKVCRRVVIKEIEETDTGLMFRVDGLPGHSRVRYERDVRRWRRSPPSWSGFARALANGKDGGE